MCKKIESKVENVQVNLKSLETRVNNIDSVHASREGSTRKGEHVEGSPTPQRGAQRRFEHPNEQSQTNKHEWSNLHIVNTNISAERTNDNNLNHV